jgi:2-keto-4-pentenoate hydratase/2-oxohepta-3-ene-1,7-dioic acid hydratase in catechol pathway
MALWVRFSREGREGFGTLEGDTIAVHAGDMFGAATPTGEAIPRGDVAQLPPVRPRVFFLKSPGSVVGPDAPIPVPAGYAGRVIYEGELGLVIGRRVSNADEAEAGRAIFGLTCVNDVTALDLLSADPSFAQWARAKGCDGFGPIGPAIATGLDWAGLRVQVALNGRVRQDYPCSDMIIPPGRIVSMISREMTLEPGDVIACGTSVGALPMRPGMAVEVTIAGIGTLRNVFAPG